MEISYVFDSSSNKAVAARHPGASATLEGVSIALKQRSYTGAGASKGIAVVLIFGNMCRPEVHRRVSPASLHREHLGPLDQRNFWWRPQKRLYITSLCLKLAHMQSFSLRHF